MHMWCALFAAGLVLSAALVVECLCLCWFLCGTWVTMASIADSSVTFASKAKQCGLTQAVLDSLAASSITTHSGLLFAVANAPGPSMTPA